MSQVFLIFLVVSSLTTNQAASFYRRPKFLENKAHKGSPGEEFPECDERGFRLGAVSCRVSESWSTVPNTCNGKVCKQAQKELCSPGWRRTQVCFRKTWRTIRDLSYVAWEVERPAPRWMKLVPESVQKRFNIGITTRKPEETTVLPGSRTVTIRTTVRSMSTRAPVMNLESITKGSDKTESHPEVPASNIEPASRGSEQPKAVRPIQNEPTPNSLNIPAGSTDPQAIENFPTTETAENAASTRWSITTAAGLAELRDALESEPITVSHHIVDTITRAPPTPTFAESPEVITSTLTAATIPGSDESIDTTTTGSMITKEGLPLGRSREYSTTVANSPASLIAAGSRTTTAQNSAHVVPRDPSGETANGGNSTPSEAPRTEKITEEASSGPTRARTTGSMHTETPGEGVTSVDLPTTSGIAGVERLPTSILETIEDPAIDTQTLRTSTMKVSGTGRVSKTVKDPDLLGSSEAVSDTHAASSMAVTDSGIENRTSDIEDSTSGSDSSRTMEWHGTGGEDKKAPTSSIASSDVTPEFSRKRIGTTEAVQVSELRQSEAASAGTEGSPLSTTPQDLREAGSPEEDFNAAAKSIRMSTTPTIANPIQYTAPIVKKQQNTASNKGSASSTRTALTPGEFGKSTQSTISVTMVGPVHLPADSGHNGKPAEGATSSQGLQESPEIEPNDRTEPTDFEVRENFSSTVLSKIADELQELVEAGNTKTDDMPDNLDDPESNTNTIASSSSPRLKAEMMLTRDSIGETESISPNPELRPTSPEEPRRNSVPSTIPELTNSEFSRSVALSARGSADGADRHTPAVLNVEATTATPADLPGPVTHYANIEEVGVDVDTHHYAGTTASSSSGKQEAGISESELGTSAAEGSIATETNRGHGIPKVNLAVTMGSGLPEPPKHSVLESTEYGDDNWTTTAPNGGSKSQSVLSTTTPELPAMPITNRGAVTTPTSTKSGASGPETTETGGNLASHALSDPEIQPTDVLNGNSGEQVAFTTSAGTLKTPENLIGVGDSEIPSPSEGQTAPAFPKTADTEDSGMIGIAPDSVQRTENLGLHSELKDSSDPAEDSASLATVIQSDGRKSPTAVTNEAHVIPTSATPSILGSSTAEVTTGMRARASDGPKKSYTEVPASLIYSGSAVTSSEIRNGEITTETVTPELFEAGESSSKESETLAEISNEEEFSPAPLSVAGRSESVDAPLVASSVDGDSDAGRTVTERTEILGVTSSSGSTAMNEDKTPVTEQPKVPIAARSTALGAAHVVKDIESTSKEKTSPDSRSLTRNDSRTVEKLADTTHSSIDGAGGISGSTSATRDDVAPNVESAKRLASPRAATNLENTALVVHTKSHPRSSTKTEPDATKIFHTTSGSDGEEASELAEAKTTSIGRGELVHSSPTIPPSVAMESRSSANGADPSVHLVDRAFFPSWGDESETTPGAAQGAAQSGSPNPGPTSNPGAGAQGAGQAGGQPKPGNDKSSEKSSGLWSSWSKPGADVDANAPTVESVLESATSNDKADLNSMLDKNDDDQGGIAVDGDAGPGRTRLEANPGLRDDEEFFNFDISFWNKGTTTLDPDALLLNDPDPDATLPPLRNGLQRPYHKGLNPASRLLVTAAVQLLLTVLVLLSCAWRRRL